MRKLKACAHFVLNRYIILKKEKCQKIMIRHIFIKNKFSTSFTLYFSSCKNFFSYIRKNRFLLI